MSPLSTYRSALGLSGPGFVVISFLARLPLAMAQLGTLLMVSEATDSYGVGGACAGAIAVGNAIGGPVSGAVTDRLGQRAVLVVQSVVAGSALLLLVALTGTVPWPLLVVVAAVAGLTLPPIGPLARVRWQRMATGHHARRRLIDTVFSLESVMDEISFVLGPALVGVFAIAFSTSTAMVIAGAMTLVFGTAFGLHRTGLLVAGPEPAGAATSGRLLTPAMVSLLLGMLAMGVIFGSSQAATSVLATDAGQPGLTGVVQAVLGIGSAIAGLSLPMLGGRIALSRRWVLFAIGLLVFAAPLLLVQGLGWLIVVLAVLGLVVAPYMITLFTLAERVVSQSRIGLAMALVGGFVGLGYAVGSSIAGRLSDWGGHTPGYAVTVAAGAVAVVTALVGRQLLRDIPEPVEVAAVQPG